MKLLTIKSGSENYVCSVVRIKEVLDHPNADRLKLVVANGNTVVVGTDTKAGDLCLYFCGMTKLSEEYCKYNNLYDKPELNRDITQKGYISHKSRVRAIKLRGVVSDGIIMPLSSLDYLPATGTLQEGQEFTDIGDISICEKYIVPVRNGNPGGKAPKQPTKVSRLVENQFYLHNDTDNLRKNVHKINPDDFIGIHYKKHGTSVVVSNCLVNRPLRWWEKGLQKFGVKIDDKEYDIIYSSRKVIKNGYLNSAPNSYYKTDIWGDVSKEVGDKIPKNYTLYGEILGYESSGSFIQKGYDYGCETGQHKFYVYRITVVNPDGKVVNLSDLQIKEFCDKRGILYSDTFIYYGKAKDKYPELSLEEHWNENFLAKLEVEYNEKNCYMCKTKVPEEGIVLRVDKGDEYEAYKLKSKAFIAWEDEAQEKEEVNIEDNQEA